MPVKCSSTEILVALGTFPFFRWILVMILNLFFFGSMFIFIFLLFPSFSMNLPVTVNAQGFQIIEFFMEDMSVMQVVNMGRFFLASLTLMILPLKHRPP